MLDAIDCMHQVRSMSDHIGDDDSLTDDLGWIISAAFHLGRISEKMKIRPFEPFVRSRMASNASIEKINELRPSTAELKLEAEEAIAKAKHENISRIDEIDLIKIKAAETLGISKRALNKRLAK